MSGAPRCTATSPSGPTCSRRSTSRGWPASTGRPCGPGSTTAARRDALGRLCAEYFDLGGLLSLIFTEPQLVDTTAWDQSDCGDVAFAAVIERGHRDGTIDPDLPVTWVQYLLWSQLYAGWSYIAETGASRHEALRLLVRTFVGAIRP